MEVHAAAPPAMLAKRQRVQPPAAGGGCGRSNKRIVHEAMRRIAEADAASIEAILEEVYTGDAEFRVSHPFNEMATPKCMAGAYWKPLFAAFPDLERRDDVVIGGEYEGDHLVGCVGNLVGTFTRAWLGIPPTGKTVYLRYGEYHKFADDGTERLSQTTAILDIVDFLQQIGFDPVPNTRGAMGRWLAPLGGQGVLTEDSDPKEGQATLQYVKDMQQALMDFKGLTEAELLSDDNPQIKFWHDKMMWYGPGGIGMCRGMKGFVRHHQMPFRMGFPTRTYGNDLRAAGYGRGHYVKIGDGAFVGTGGWPSVVAVHGGAGWLGLESTGKTVQMRVMDFYHVHDGVIRENWVPIDVCHIMLQCGIDVLAQAREHFGCKGAGA